eukprot:9938114-Karenia_brevis.AAC.1
MMRSPPWPGPQMPWAGRVPKQSQKRARAMGWEGAPMGPGVVGSAPRRRGGPPGGPPKKGRRFA